MRSAAVGQPRREISGSRRLMGNQESSWLLPCRSCRSRSIFITCVTKEELISQLCNSKNNFIVGLASLALLADPDAQNLLKEKSADLSGYSVPFDQVAALLSSACDRQVALEEFAKSVLRCLVKEGHELVTQYCKSEGLYSDLSAQSWWQFSRLVRNALSHDFCFRLNEKDLKLLPVSW